jgi:intracellular septation protein A
MGVGFDSGGVTTGPITVPFILALGAGVSAVRAGRRTEEDSFGLCALCSIGPILAVLIMGIFYGPAGTGYAFETPATADSIGELAALYAGGLVGFFKEVSLILLPIVVFFGAFQIVRLRLPRSQLIRIGVGLVYILLGLTIFLTGVYIGFMPAGTYLGHAIASLPNNWILIPLGLVIGFFIVAAEPAVHILNKQIEDITNGAISRRVMMLALSIGVGIALVLAMIRVLTSIDIWYFLLPGYAVALLLTFVVPEIFTAVAFDSGGVAAGTMAAAFLLPFALGATDAVGGPLLLDAFGIIGMVAMMPLITVQVVGLVYQIKMRRAEAEERKRAKRETFENENVEIIDL